MAYRRPRRWAKFKPSDLKRPCRSGKKSFAQPGDARAAAPTPEHRVYRCRHCKRFHIADPVPRYERQARARGLAA